MEEENITKLVQLIQIVEDFSSQKKIRTDKLKTAMSNGETDWK